MAICWYTYRNGTIDTVREIEKFRGIDRYRFRHRGRCRNRGKDKNRVRDRDIGRNSFIYNAGYRDRDEDTKVMEIKGWIYMNIALNI